MVFCIRDMAIEYFHLGVNPIFRESYTVGQGEGKAQGLHHYRGLHQLRRLCGGLPPAGHHLGRAQRHPPGALPPLRQLRGTLPRGGRYTKGAGDRPSGNLTKGSCGLLGKSSHPTFLIFSHVDFRDALEVY